MNLSPQQLEAVHTNAPAVLCIAPAGAGKSQVLSERIAHLISQGVAPGSILALTFTRAAAELNLSQPGLSRRIGYIERAVGAKVFERLHGKVQLTEVGQALMPHVHAALANLRRRGKEIHAELMTHLEKFISSPRIRGVIQEALITERFGRVTAGGLTVLESLYSKPITSVTEVRALTKISFPAASDLVKRLVDHGLLTEKTGHARNRRFSYDPYIAIFSEDEPSKDRPS